MNINNSMIFAMLTAIGKCMVTITMVPPKHSTFNYVDFFNAILSVSMVSQFSLRTL